MKTLNNYILILSVSLFIILAGCKKREHINYT